MAKATRLPKVDLKQLGEERRQMLAERERFPERYVQWCKLHRKRQSKKAE